MLVLTRRRMESIAIGGRIRITVVKVDRNQVRLGNRSPGRHDGLAGRIDP